MQQNGEVAIDLEHVWQGEALIKHVGAGELQATQPEEVEVALKLTLILVAEHDALAALAYDPNSVEEDWITMEVDFHRAALRNRDVHQVGVQI